MNDLNLTIDELGTAIEHLTAAARLLQECQKNIASKAFIGNKVSGSLADAWYQINLCRLYTETSVTFEGYIQTAMGQIVDAKEMLDSLIHWGKGITWHAQRAILYACSEAVRNADVVLNELEQMLSEKVQESEFAQSLTTRVRQQ